MSPAVHSRRVSKVVMPRIVGVPRTFAASSGRFGDGSLRLVAVTTVTGRPSASTRRGRSRRSQCDMRAGSVEIMISSNAPPWTACCTATKGSAASNVAKSTCWEWVHRWRQASAEERRSLACLATGARGRTRARPRCRRTRPRGSASGVSGPGGVRGGCSRRPCPDHPAVVRYEWPCPGNLLHMDVKKLR